MKSKFFTKRLLAVLVTAAMIVTGPGFSLSALGAQAEPDDLAATEQKDADKADSGVSEGSVDEEIVLKDRVIKASDKDYEITIKGKLPEDATLDVNEIVRKDDPANDNDYEDYEKAAVKEVFENDKELDGDSLPYLRFFDININYAGGSRTFQPDDSVKMIIDTKDDTLKDEELKTKALHFADNKKYTPENEENKYVADIVDSDIKNKDTESNKSKKDEDKDKELEVTAESFSVYGVAAYYTVDFYYDSEGKSHEYHMNGGSEIKLSELFGKLGIDRGTSDIDKVDFTDNSLIEVSKDGDDFILKSLKPFKSVETLTVTFKDGAVIEIRTEDEIAEGKFGLNNSVRWEIDDYGNLVIEPVSGTQGNIGEDNFTSFTTKNGSVKRDNRNILWPWEEYRDKIVTATIKSEIISYGDKRYIGMFEWCDNLTTVDVSGLNVARTNELKYFFANCPKLKTIKGLDKWSESVNRKTDEKVGTSAITDVTSMFRNCSALEKLDLSTWTSTGNMKFFTNLCNGCSSLTSFTLNNENFVMADKCQLQTKYSGQGMFNGCNRLQTVDMSNITIKAPDYFKYDEQLSLKGLFENLQALREVNMANIKLVDNTSPDYYSAMRMDDMFKDCGNLQKLTITPRTKLPRMRSMRHMVYNCTSLETLDLSKMDNSRNLPGGSELELGIETLSSLKTFIADNSCILILKNTEGDTERIPHKMEDVVASRDMDFVMEAEWDFTPKGKYPGGAEYTGDTTKITSRGAIQLIMLDPEPSGNNPNYKYPNPNPMYYLAPGKYKRTSDTTKMEVPSTYYVIDKMESKKPIVEIWDGSKYVNVSEKATESGSINGLCFVTGIDGRFTRIYTDRLSMSEWAAKTDNDNNICTYKAYDSDHPCVRVTYSNAATSVNGTTHDVVININSISFRNMNRIPNTTDSTYKNPTGPNSYEEISNPWGPGSNRSDKNKIPGYINNWQGYDGKYDRYLINAVPGEMCFWNQITTGTDHYHETTDEFMYLYSKGSGTYIDFDLKIAGADENQSVLYWCDDLDMPENEYWTMDPSNPNEDVRNGVNYGPGGEGIALGRGTDLDSVTMLPKDKGGLLRKHVMTGMRSSTENYIVGSEPDAETSLSRFYVKSDAKDSSYKWTSGISCETSILKSRYFQRSDVLDINIKAAAGKKVNGKTPDDAFDNTFEFELEPDKDTTQISYEGENYPNSATNGYEKMTARNTKGEAEFDTMSFVAPGANYKAITGKLDPVYNSYQVYKDSNNIEFFYDWNGDPKTWKENKQGTGDEVTVWYEEVNYEPSSDTLKAYMFRIKEKKGDDIAITKWDDTEYYLKLITIAPQADEDIPKGTKVIGTVAKKVNGSIDWDHPVQTFTEYGQDLKGEPIELENINFANECTEYILPKGSINVQKTLDGRNWKDSDEFRISLVREHHDDPMPEGSVITADIAHDDVLLTNSDTKVDDKTYTDSDGFGAITFTGADMKDTDGSMLEEKTFRYMIREEEPEEGGDDRIPGITYTTERYAVDVTIETEDGKLALKEIKYYKVTENSDEEVIYTPLGENKLPAFTNSYDAERTIYKMAADKSFVTHVSGKELKDHDYRFTLKPYGEYAKVAPMPKNSTGSEENRSLTVSNVNAGVKFDDADDPEDGLVFDYKQLRDSLVPDYFRTETELFEALHSGEGVHFSYELYEEIPDEAVNNDDGTYTLDHSDANTTTEYDGIHHIRMITVKVVNGDPTRVKDGAGNDKTAEITVDSTPLQFEIYRDFEDVEFYYLDNVAYKYESNNHEENQRYTPDLETLFVSGHADDHNDDYYLKSDGTKVVVKDGVDGYDARKHHTGIGGIPVFHNEYVPYKGSVEVNKTWQDFGDTGKRTVLTFMLYKQGPGDDEPVPVTKDAKGHDVRPKQITTKKDGSVRWDDLPVFEKIGDEIIKVRYSVKEEGVDDSYVTTILPDDVELEKDKTSSINVKNIRIKDKITKTVKQTIHYVSDKGKTLFKDHTASVTFTATPRIVREGGKIVVDDDGNIEVEWLDEEGKVIGKDHGDGSGINYKEWKKKFPAVKSPEKDHYTYDIPLIGEQTVSAADKDSVYKVIYRPDSYKIHFNANTGTGTMGDQQMFWDDTKNLDANLFTKVGYTFKGWNTKPDGSGDSYKDKQSVINFVDKNGNEITLYAQWEKTAYTVIYEDGAHGKSNGGKTTKYYGDKPQSNTVTAEEGYKFTGRYDYVITDNDGNVISKGTTTDPESITVIGNIVFTPIYEASPANKDKKDKKKKNKKSKKKSSSKKKDNKNKNKNKNNQNNGNSKKNNTETNKKHNSKDNKDKGNKAGKNNKKESGTAKVHKIRRTGVSTGDSLNLLLFTSLFITSGIAAAFLLATRRRKKGNDNG